MKRIYITLFLVVGAIFFGTNYFNSENSVEVTHLKETLKTAVLTRLDNTKANKLPVATAGVITTQTKQEGNYPYAKVFPDMPNVADFSTYNPQSITVEVEPGIPVTYNRTNSYVSHGRLIWVGRNPEVPFSVYTSAGTKDHYYAAVDLSMGRYAAEIHNGVVTTFHDDKPINCAHASPEVNESKYNLKHAHFVQGNHTEQEHVHTASALVTSPSEVLTVDVSIFADEASIDLNGYDHMLTRVLANFEVTNQYLINSQITNFRWNVAHLVVVPKSLYKLSYNMSADLDLMTYNETTKGTLAHFVKTNMDAAGTDQGMLLVTGENRFAGMALVGGNLSIVRYDQIIYSTVAHELGHNFGALHDRITEKATDTDIRGYNYGFKHNDAWTTSLGKISTYYYGDIMSYAGVYAPFFSNPNITYTYRAIDAGVNVTVNLGVDLDKDYPSFAAKTIMENAARMASNATYKVHLKQQPFDTTVSAGEDATLTAVGPPGSTYQWQKDGVDIKNATQSTLTIGGVSSLNSGIYTCVVTVNGTVITSNPATISVAAMKHTNSNARLVNISTRSQVRAGDAVQIAGFILSGNRDAKVLVRASGPALANFGINGYLTDPALTIYNNESKPITSNDNWDYNSVNTVAQTVGAFNWIGGSRDSALVQTLPCSSYTSVVEGKSSSNGVSLIEVYDTSDPADITSPKMINISTRSWVDAHENAQIAGFVLGGTGLKTVLVRASGPGLASFGVSHPVADPIITLYDSKGVILFSNDNWGDNSDLQSLTTAATETGAFAFTPGSKDSAILVTLPTGAYTAVVSPKSGTTPGVGLVEVYEVK